MTILAAIAGTFFQKKPHSRQTKIGVLNAAKAEFTKLVMPPMYSMNGDMMVETTATTVPKF